MKKILFGLLACLSLASCSKAWIDESPREALLTITYNGPVDNNGILGQTHPVSYKLSNGVAGHANNPPYAEFLISLDGQMVKYKFGSTGHQDFIRIFRGEVYMDLSLEQKVTKK